MSKDKIRIRNLMLRCYANKQGDQWQAFCIDFCLAAQGDSLAEVKGKLESIMVEYVYDAMAGEDREFAEQLLNRRAPIDQYATYYVYKFLHKIGILHNGIHNVFKQMMPLEPQRHLHA